MDIRFLITACDDPYRNLAVEELLLRDPGDCTLYLWQNANTVVIGRNQNPWRECRLDAMEAAGCRLARRTTGGGAVYHDMGNLNFTFAARSGVYDKERQLSVILRAVERFGIKAHFSGRNDVVTESEAKFSGSAYLERADASLHHGTLLVAADMSMLASFLAPPKEKYEAKGVASVRSRVVNLSELSGTVSVPRLAGAVVSAFEEEYGAARPLCERELDRELLAEITRRNSSEEWLLGKTPPFTVEHSARLPIGLIRLLLDVRDGVILSAKCESDAMDADMIESLSAALAGCPYDGAAMAARATGDTAKWLAALA